MKVGRSHRKSIPCVYLHQARTTSLEMVPPAVAVMLRVLVSVEALCSRRVSSGGRLLGSEVVAEMKKLMKATASRGEKEESFMVVDGLEVSRWLQEAGSRGEEEGERWRRQRGQNVMGEPANFMSR